MKYSEMNAEGLKPYFFDLFKQCYCFYPKVEMSKEKVRITSVYNNKQIKVIESVSILPINIMLPIAVSKWKKKFLSKFKHMKEDDVENWLDFSDRLVELHSEIKRQITENGKLKFFDIPIILNTVNNLISLSLNRLKYLKYSATKAKISFSNFTTIESDIEYTIGNYHEVTKVQVIV